MSRICTPCFLDDDVTAGVKKICAYVWVGTKRAIKNGDEPIFRSIGIQIFPFSSTCFFFFEHRLGHVLTETDSLDRASLCAFHRTSPTVCFLCLVFFFLSIFSSLTERPTGNGYWWFFVFGTFVWFGLWFSFFFLWFLRRPLIGLGVGPTNRATISRFLVVCVLFLFFAFFLFSKERERERKKKDSLAWLG